MDQLRVMFVVGPDSGFMAQEIFTDRMTEFEAFTRAVDSVVTFTSAADRSIDPRLPRRNVLVYYGIGGIGKTALSRQLERRIVEAAIDGLPRARATVRVDFGEAGDFDIWSY